MSSPLPSDRRRSWRGAALIGIGIMAAVDEIIFHQLLGWHHFYDGGTPTIGLISDGLLHAAELVALVAGFFVLSDVLRRQSFSWRAAAGGLLTGAGGFQLFDGLINHKILRLHQIRYDVESLLIYDLTWNGIAVLLLMAGIYFSRKRGAEKDG